MIREASARAELVETDTQAVGGAQGTQALESAKAARLRYVSDATPGYKRRKNGKSFIYFAPDGTRIRDAEELRRFQSLAIPPAWRDVWICPLANGHLQASGRDAKGRKQHRHHPRWREIRDESKYDRMVAFARKLPAIRRQVKQDLALTSGRVACLRSRRAGPADSEDEKRQKDQRSGRPASSTAKITALGGERQRVQATRP